MTVRGFLLALALFASAPTEAASCHRYSRWFYPWPQACGGQKFVHVRHVVPPPAEDQPDLDIPLPFLARADLAGGEADEVTAARLTLLGYAHAH